MYNYCDQVVDLDDLVRVSAILTLHFGVDPFSHSQLTNEFQFPIASVDASEAWLVPDLLNKT